MRLILFLAAIVTAGAVGVAGGVIPLPAPLVRDAVTSGGRPALVKTVDVNPVETYNRTLPQILKGHSQEDMSVHGAAVTIPPGSFRGLNSTAVNPVAIGQNGFAAGALSQIQQNNQRMQDMAAYARNPAGWHGAPPH